MSVQKDGLSPDYLELWEINDRYPLELLWGVQSRSFQMSREIWAADEFGGGGAGELGAVLQL